MKGIHVVLEQERPIPLLAELDCAPGEVVGLVGPSGSGKTTVLRSIAGTYRPMNGRIRVNGAFWFSSEMQIEMPPHRRRVGMVFQNYALFPHMSAEGNIRAAMGHLPKARRKERASELLELVHLQGLGDRLPSELSRGQQQRVAIARALARDPSVLLLDEPFSAVDKATRQRLYREIAQLRGGLNMPVLLVTHDMEEAAMLADRLVILHRGQTLQQGTPEEVTNRPVSPAVARLLDMRNIFAGRIADREALTGKVYIDWAGMRIEANSAPDISTGEAVSWVVPDGFVVLHRRDRPSRGEHENPVPGRIGTFLAIGQTAHLTLRPRHAPELPLHFTVPLHVARRNGIAADVEAAVSLLSEGIHVMDRTDGLSNGEEPDGA